MLIFGEWPVVMMMLFPCWLTGVLRPGGLLLAAVALFATSIGLMFTPVFLLKPSKFAILVSLSRFPCFQIHSHLASRSVASLVCGEAVAHSASYPGRAANYHAAYFQGHRRSTIAVEAPLGDCRGASLANGVRWSGGVPLMTSLATARSTLDPLHRSSGC